MTRTALLLTGLVALFLGSAVGTKGPDSDDAVLLVANKNGHSLYFVDPASGRVTDSVSTGKGPHEVAAAPAARRAYVANYAEGTISVIDVETQTNIDEWALDGARRPHGIAVGPNEERLYVTAEDQRAVLELDAATGTVRRTFETEKKGTHMLALTPDASALYATSIGSGTASKVDLDAGRVVDHTQTGAGAEGVAVTPNGQEVWVTNRADDTVSVLEAASASVVDSLSVPGFPIRVALSPNGRHALVSAPRAGETALYDVQDRRLLARLEVGEKPIGVLAPSSSRAFVANAGSGTVSVVDLTARTVVDTISAGQGPDGMAYLPAE